MAISTMMDTSSSSDKVGPVSGSTSTLIKQPLSQLMLKQETVSQMIDRFLSLDCNFLQLHDSLKASLGMFIV
jgi:hypothetical protein